MDESVIQFSQEPLNSGDQIVFVWLLFILKTFKMQESNFFEVY